MLQENGYRIGIDVGGTFTDVVVVNEVDGAIFTAKVPTVPSDPSQGCLNGIEQALVRYDIAASDITFAVHGTTIATNTLIEGKIAKAGLLATEGFRDILEIAYQTRPSLYDIFYEKPKPLIERRHCIGIPERMRADGEIIVELDENAVRDAARHLRSENVEAIVISFLHSYRNPIHEQRARALVMEECPGISVTISSDICQEYREYPRTSTAVVNAVLEPRVAPYLRALEKEIAKRGIVARLHLMTSSGGIVAVDVAKEKPVMLIESGPAGGVIGANFVAGKAGYKDILALDIGGTTAKAAVVMDGKPSVSDQFEVGSQAVAAATAHRGQGYPVRTPVIPLVEIGTGGGSLAYVDKGGALSVGPESAGATPGPAAYGAGGTRPTLTDANVVLGRINPSYFLGGEQTLRVDLAHSAIKKHVAEPLGMTVEDAALAIVELANARMAAALHFVSVEQGIDPRDFVLVVSGGGGPMQAAAIASQIGMTKVLVPPTPGLNSAIGMLATDLRHEVARTSMLTEHEVSADDLREQFGAMVIELKAILSSESVDPTAQATVCLLDMCYDGQSFGLEITVDPDKPDGDILAEAVASFHSTHKAKYGYNSCAETVRILRVRTISIGKVARPKMREIETSLGEAPQPVETRRVVFRNVTGDALVPIYRRETLCSGDRLQGPAIIEQPDTTIVVPPEFSVAVDAIGNLVMTCQKPIGGEKSA